MVRNRRGPVVGQPLLGHAAVEVKLALLHQSVAVAEILQTAVHPMPCPGDDRFAYAANHGVHAHEIALFITLQERQSIYG